MWAIKLKGKNIYVGTCVVPQPGFTVAAFPGNEVYWPTKFSDESAAKKAMQTLNSRARRMAEGGEWEVVPYPTATEER